LDLVLKKKLIPHSCLLLFSLVIGSLVVSFFLESGFVFFVVCAPDFYWLKKNGGKKKDPQPWPWPPNISPIL
jgi:hypothetical protein